MSAADAAQEVRGYSLVLCKFDNLLQVLINERKTVKFF